MTAKSGDSHEACSGAGGKVRVMGLCHRPSTDDDVEHIDTNEWYYKRDHYAPERQQNDTESVQTRGSWGD